MNLDVVDGGLYLEFSKCLRIYLLNIEDDDDILFFWLFFFFGCKFVLFLVFSRWIFGYLLNFKYKLLLIIFKFMFLEKFCVKKNL